MSEADASGGKLVRDRIPDLIRRNGGQPRTRRLSDEEFATALTRKLIEEAEEVALKPSAEELADVLDVIRALADTLGVPMDDIEAVRRAKAAERGGFDERLLLAWVTDPGEPVQDDQPLAAKSQPIFPEAGIETPRLLLRPHRAENAPDVALACRDELSQRWLPLPNPYTDADALAWCTEMAPRFRVTGEGIEWAAIRRADDRLIGSFGLKRTDWRARSSEIGYWVAPWMRGKGLAVEAVLAIARWLLIEQAFERMVLRAAIGNTASQRVAEKAGFTREGIARNAGYTNDGRIDLVVFSLVPTDLATKDDPEDASR